MCIVVVMLTHSRHVAVPTSLYLGGRARFTAILKEEHVRPGAGTLLNDALIVSPVSVDLLWLLLLLLLLPLLLEDGRGLGGDPGDAQELLQLVVLVREVEVVVVLQRDEA